MPTSPSLSRDDFAAISSLSLEDAASWQGKVFLSFDLDWAHDEVIEDAVDLVEEADVRATWFVTHETKLLDRLRANPKFELGIHPNYLPLLLQGSHEKGASAKEVLETLLEIVPEAKSVRTHSLVQSGRLTELYHRHGLTHEANAFVPVDDANLTPWIDWFGVIRVPHRWEDDYWCYTGRPAQLIAPTGLTVLCFHPIHVFLNTEKMARYEAARASFSDPEALLAHRFAGEGVRYRLQSLLERAR